MDISYSGSQMSPVVDERSNSQDPKVGKTATKGWMENAKSLLWRLAEPPNDSASLLSQGKPLLGSHNAGRKSPKVSEEIVPRFLRLNYIGLFHPQADPDHPDARTFRILRSKRLFILYACCILASLVLLANVVGTVWFKTNWNTIGDLGRVYQGDCLKAKRLNSLLHLVINVLSTMLLGASNLCMQLLIAPIRKEVDQAHKKFLWLDIGVPSFRNLRHISPQRSATLVLLAASSIPLHFLYNSAIVSTVPINTYAYVVVTPEFMNGGRWNVSETIRTQSMQPSNLSLSWNLQTWDGPLHLQSTIQSMQAASSNTTVYARWERAECINRYNTLLGNRSDLIIVTSKASATNNSLLAYGIDRGDGWNIGYGLCPTGTNSFDCGKLSALPEAQQKEMTKDWNFGGHQVDYCLSSEQSLDHLCAVEYTFSVMLFVCLFNCLKLAGIIYTAWHYSRRSDAPLSIMGDAISSFLQDPDPSTRGMSIASKQEFCKEDHFWRKSGALEYQRLRPRWSQAVSRRRWIVGVSSIIVTMIAGTIFLGTSMAGLRDRKAPTDLRSLIKNGFGFTDAKATVGLVRGGTSERALYLNIAFANVWQLIISLLYLAYNALLTAMLVGDEWDRFAKTRKTLRVTSPQGIQRSSYSISVPFAYGIPVMVSICVLHYTVSQSIFVVYMHRFFSNGVEDTAYRGVACGYSCIAMIASLMIGAGLLLLLIGLGWFRRFKNGMPVASTCSAAISAACHAHPQDADAHMLWVQWGVVDVDPKSGIGHCSFTTARDVTAESGRPRPGKLYA